MPKFIYKPIPAKVEEIYQENAGKTFFPNGLPEDMPVRVVVEAENEDAAMAVRIGITDIRMWELESTEE